MPTIQTRRGVRCTRGQAQSTSAGLLAALLIAGGVLTLSAVLPTPHEQDFSLPLGSPCRLPGLGTPSGIVFDPPAGKLVRLTWHTNDSSDAEVRLYARDTATVVYTGSGPSGETTFTSTGTPYSFAGSGGCHTAADLSETYYSPIITW